MTGQFHVTVSGADMRRAVIELRSALVKIDIEVELRPRQSVHPHLTIDREPVQEYTELAISMLGWERRGGRWRESVGGQGTDYVLEHFGTAPYVRELCAIWRRWHLNGMRPGTRPQFLALSVHAQELKGAADHFGAAEALLTELGLNPHNGYKHGSAWLVELLPALAEARIIVLVTELGGKFVEIAEVA